MPYAKTSLRAEQRALRDKMRELGMSHHEISVEFARRYQLRPRAAWRNAYGWSLTQAAERISTYAARAGLGSGATVAMTGAHLSEYENWPGLGTAPTGRRPTPYLLSLLAAVYGCAIQDLLDVADYKHMPAPDRLVLDKTTTSGPAPDDIVAGPTARQRSPQPAPSAMLDPDAQMPGSRSRDIGNLHPIESAVATGTIRGTVVGRSDPGLDSLLSGVGPRAGYLSMAGALPVLNPDQVRHIAAALANARRYADSAVSGYLQDQLTAYAVSDGTRGPKETLPLVLAIVAAVECTARDARAAVRRDLLAVGARGAEFAGWLYRDSAVLRLAGYWHDRAVEWAQLAAETALQGYVLLKKSQAAWDERDAPRMLMLARATTEGPWDLPVHVQAEAIQQEARAEAMLGGDIRMIAARLDQAQNLLAQVSHASGGGRSALAAHYCPSLLAIQMAICYCEAGQPARAVEIYDEHLTADAFSRRDFGYFRALQGIAVASSGRPDDAATIGRESVQIAAATSSARTFTELSRLMDQLAKWPGRPEVQVFGAELAAGLSQVR
jgi:hypothetical protein